MEAGRELQGGVAGGQRVQARLLRRARGGSSFDGPHDSLDAQQELRRGLLVAMQELLRIWYPVPPVLRQTREKQGALNQRPQLHLRRREAPPERLLVAGAQREARG
eukprot:CAMPEP_0179174274 /NCGR_PEP_ID=MMETSP0796-20121207/86038_1 /TAXON_ID=73915 /ORGANISM="Pyrodinium bahamense, Strain pbaha01" /LENGTH=105 /DNA_ID=CAMNT_0020877565 /DNA_START=16 /DNA_END=330 /DNA_ORIENTATION=+